MALVLKDRVKETTTTTGTGTVTLAGASTGYQSFSAIGNANTTYYCIAGQGTNEWEVGVGTYTSSGTTLSRDTILASSNSGSAVNFSAGTKDVFVVYPAGKSANTNFQLTSGRVPYATTDGLLIDASSLTFTSGTGALSTPEIEASNGLIVNNMTVGTSYTIPSGYSASSVGPVTVSGGVSVTVPSGSRWVVL
jgi:hypothetical protein